LRHNKKGKIYFSASAQKFGAQKFNGAKIYGAQILRVLG